MAEKAAIFGRMIFGQGRNSFREMAFNTEFFRLFFLHLLETTMIRVFGQFCGSLFRGVEQEQENGATGEDEGDIQENGLVKS